MAKPIKRGDKWFVQVYKNGKRRSASFETKTKANAWAIATELDLIKELDNAHHNKTVADLLEKYKESVSIKKAGFKSECIRIDRLLRDPIANILLADFSKKHVAEWRDRRLDAKVLRNGRLQNITGSTVNREWCILSHAFKIAINEWEWIDVNPFLSVEKPANSPHRDRLITENEIEKLCHVMGYKNNIPLLTFTSRAAAAFLFAIETAMRSQEICNLKWSDVKGNVATIRKSKTNAGIRQTPLSHRAIEIIKQLEKSTSKEDCIFNITPPQIDALFRNAKRKAMIDNLHFHDSRHEAVTRLAGVYENVVELARSIGHADLSQLMVYYNQSAENLAKKLNAKVLRTVL